MPVRFSDVRRHLDGRGLEDSDSETEGDGALEDEDLRLEVLAAGALGKKADDGGFAAIPAGVWEMRFISLVDRRKSMRK